MLCCASLKSLQGFIPTGLHLCITALLPAFRMSRETKKKTTSPALLLSLWCKLLMFATTLCEQPVALDFNDSVLLSVCLLIKVINVYWPSVFWYTVGNWIFHSHLINQQLLILTVTHYFVPKISHDHYDGLKANLHDTSRAQ